MRPNETLCLRSKTLADSAGKNQPSYLVIFIFLVWLLYIYVGSHFIQRTSMMEPDLVARFVTQLENICSCVAQYSPFWELARNSWPPCSSRQPEWQRWPTEQHEWPHTQHKSETGCSASEEKALQNLCLDWIKMRMVKEKEMWRVRLHFSWNFQVLLLLTINWLKFHMSVKCHSAAASICYCPPHNSTAFILPYLIESSAAFSTENISDSSTCIHLKHLQ